MASITTPSRIRPWAGTSDGQDCPETSAYRSRRRRLLLLSRARVPNAGVRPRSPFSSDSPLAQPQLVYRLLGYGGLAVLALCLLARQAGPVAGVLLLVALLWPLLWWRCAPRLPALRDANARGAAVTHSIECLLLVMLLWAAPVPDWLPPAVGLLALAGVTALGGLRMLLCCAPWVTLFGLLAVGRPSPDWSVDGPSLVAALLVTVCLLGLAWQAHRQAKALSAGRHAALSESSRLASHNARLSRYLPGTLPALTAAPERPQPPREVFLTVAFLDLEGFAELVRRHSVAEVVDVMNDYMSTVNGLISHHGGELSKFLGDGMLVYFGGGRRSSRVLAAASCLYFTRELEAAMVELSSSWRRRGLGLALTVRVGVASGYCALGDWGGQSRLDYTLIGTPVNLASRLQALARPGRVLISGTAAALLEQVPGLGEQLGTAREVALKGLGPVVVHEVDASAKVRAIPPPERSVKADV